MKLFLSLGRFHRLFVLTSLVVFACGIPCDGQQADVFGPIQTYLNGSVENGTVAGGAVLVFHDGEVVFQTGFGFADVESKRAFAVNTPAVIASISKPIIGTTMFRLADAGAADLAAPITEYLPEFTERKLTTGAPLNRPPTINELLTHSSGIRHDSAKGGRIWYQEWTRNKTLEEVMTRVAKEFPFVSQPGTKFAYSGIGTDVVARVGEVVTRLPRNEFLRTHLCAELDMEDTFYRDAAALKRSGLQMPTRYYRSRETGKLRAIRKRPVPKEHRYSASGGSIVSTAPDLLKWLLVIRNGGVHGESVFLSEEATSRMLEERPFGNIAAGGLFIRARDKHQKPITYGHTGSSGTNVWIDFESDTIGIMLTQTRGSDIRPFRKELEQKIMKAITQLK